MSEHEGWVHIVSGGINQIASPEYVKQKILGICELKSELRRLQDFVSSLEGRIYELETPKREKAILKLLEEDHGQHTDRWFASRILPFGKSKYWDLEELVKQGRIVKVRVGTRNLYGVPLK